MRRRRSPSSRRGCALATRSARRIACSSRAPADRSRDREVLERAQVRTARFAEWEGARRVAFDEAQMRELYDGHHRRLYAMALRLTGSVSDAEDVLQETFLRAWRFSDSYRGEAAVGTWLYRIAVNVSRDVARRRGTVAEDPPERAAPPAGDAAA